METLKPYPTLEAREFSEHLIRCSVSSASFHYWYQTLSNTRLLQKRLAQHLSGQNSIDGIELSVSNDELSRWGQRLSAGHQELPGPLMSSPLPLAKAILGLSANTIHLEPLSQLPCGDEKWLAQQLQTVNAFTGVTEFTVHPDDFAFPRWNKILAGLTDGITLSVENMDPRKSGFQELSEIEMLLQNFPTLTVTLDICHWLELGYTLDEPELLTFMQTYGPRIPKIHFSVPRSESSVYGEPFGIETSHHLWRDSSVMIPQAFFAALPTKTTFVIEGVIPAGNFLSFENELSLIQNTVLTPDSRLSRTA